MITLEISHNKVKVAVEMSPAATVGDVKATLEIKTGVLVKRQTCWWSGRLSASAIRKWM